MNFGSLNIFLEFIFKKNWKTSLIRNQAGSNTRYRPTGATSPWHAASHKATVGHLGWPSPAVKSAEPAHAPHVAQHVPETVAARGVPMAAQTSVVDRGPRWGHAGNVSGRFSGSGPHRSDGSIMRWWEEAGTAAS
jgi:hypothetical protein